MKSVSNGGVLKGNLQMLHVHVLLVAPLGTSYMAQPGTDQHEGRVAVRETARHTGAAADLPVQPLNDIVGADTGPGVLWNQRSPGLPKKPQAKARIQLALNSGHKLPVSKAKEAQQGSGGPGALWHPKSQTLPKAPGQSPRIRLWHQKSHFLPKAVSQSPNSACAEFGNQNADFK